MAGACAANGDRRYVVVTRARDEAKTLRAVVASMRSQVHPPLEWVIVDDGSSDDTGAIADEAAASESWIRVLHREDRGHRRMGEGGTFYAGFEHLTTQDWCFVANLDADLSFPPEYFDRLLARFEADERLGIAGGAIHEDVEGELRFVPHPLFHVRGAVKLYRRACWDAIGGMPRQAAFDTLDELRANHLGWTTRTFLDLPVHHLRPTGGSIGAWPYAVKNGRMAWCAGYHPLFLVVRAVKVTFATRSPRAGAGLLWGYVRAPFTGDKAPERELRRYVHRQQLRRLAGRPSMWR